MFTDKTLVKENRATIRFNDHQQKRVEIAAAELELSVAEFVRKAADKLAKEITINSNKNFKEVEARN